MRNRLYLCGPWPCPAGRIWGRWHRQRGARLSRRYGRRLERGRRHTRRGKSVFWKWVLSSPVLSLPAWVMAVLAAGLRLSFGKDAGIDQILTDKDAGLRRGAA